MRRPITYLNIGLLLVAVWMAGQVRTTWRRNHARYAALAATRPAAPPAGKAAGPGAAPQPAAADYSEVVSRNLFTPERNNEQPVAGLERRPPPPVPYVVGTVRLGSGMVALMADQKQAAQGSFRRVKLGEEIGGYRLAAIAEHQVVIEYEGQKTTIDVYESAQSVRGIAGGGMQMPEVTAPSSPPAPAVTTAVPGTAAAPFPASSATPMGGSAAGAPPAPAGAVVDPFITRTVEGSRVKVVRQTPFGPQVWYEELPKP